MVCLGVASNAVYLEGEIDAVSFDGDGSAFLVDYKTGGSPDESAARVFGKHLLQAQCYALALMAQGSPRVTATFVRVEQESIVDASQPQTVEYAFTEEDREVLEQAVLSAYAPKPFCVIGMGFGCTESGSLGARVKVNSWIHSLQT